MVRQVTVDWHESGRWNHDTGDTPRGEISITEQTITPDTRKSIAVAAMVAVERTADSSDFAVWRSCLREVAD